jgi:hypothetical protein
MANPADRAARVQTLIDGGMSFTKATETVGAEEGIGGRAVRKWLDSHGGVDVVKTPPPQFADFNARQRATVGNRLAALVAQTIEMFQKAADGGTPVSPRELKELALAFGILTDKRRLEDGEATGRVETLATDARQTVVKRLDELARRRATKTADTG